MPQRVYIAFLVQCNCQSSPGHKPGIEGAPVELQVLRGDGQVDKTLYGRTQAGGWFIERYERAEIFPLSEMIGSVIACDQKVPIQTQQVTASISPQGILDFFSGARDLEWPNPTPQGILDALEITVPVSTDLQMWLITTDRPIEVQCHADCSQLTPHSTELILSGDGKPYAAITVAETFERIIFGRNRKKYTYRVRNTEAGETSTDRIISDFRICFEKPEDLEQLQSWSGPTGSWKARKDGRCLVFEVENDAYGIQPGKSGDFVLEVLASAEEGKVEVTVSWLRYDGGGHENLTEPDSVPGPAFARLERPDTTGILMVTGDLPASLPQNVKTLLAVGGRQAYEIQDPHGKMTTLVVVESQKLVGVMQALSRPKNQKQRNEGLQHVHKPAEPQTPPKS